MSDVQNQKINNQTRLCSVFFQTKKKRCGIDKTRLVLSIRKKTLLTIKNTVLLEIIMEQELNN